MSRQGKFKNSIKDTVQTKDVQTLSQDVPSRPKLSQDNNIPVIHQSANPRQSFRDGIKPEPTPPISVSPLTAPKLNKEYTTLGISNNSTPKPPAPAPQPQNNAPTVGPLPPPQKEGTQPPASQPVTPPPGSPPEQTAAQQSFSPPPGTSPSGEPYTMPGNYAKRTAEDIYNGVNYALKWQVAPWLYVSRKREFIRYEKATKEMSEISPKIPTSNLTARLKTHNAGIRDKMALDDEDKELFVPAFSAWFHETGFHISPGARAAMAAGQIALRKLGDVGQIRRENKEFTAELQEEVSRFLEIYEKEIKPALNAAKAQASVPVPEKKEEPPKPKQ